MTTETQKNQNGKAQAEKIVFVEYSSYEKGQHFMSIMQNKKIQAQVFKEWDKGIGKFLYTAKDKAGNLVFSATENLYALKKQFVDRAKNIIQEITPDAMPKGEGQNKATPAPQTRQEEIQKARKANSPEKSNDITR